MFLGLAGIEERFLEEREREREKREQVDLMKEKGWKACLVGEGLMLFRLVSFLWSRVKEYSSFFNSYVKLFSQNEK